MSSRDAAQPLPPEPLVNKESPQERGFKTPLVIDVFTDFLCPYCSRSFTENILPLTETEFFKDGDITIAFHFPSLEGDRDSDELIHMAICVEDQEKGKWETLRELFIASNNDSAKSAREVFVVSGGDEILLDECLQSQSFMQQMDHDGELFTKKSIKRIPTILIGEEKIIGVVPFENVTKTIRNYLKTL